MEQFATEVVEKLRNSGYTAFFAGGCVRDKLLNVAPKDFDVATSALPEQVRQVFGRKRTIAIGLSFGVITVLGPKPHQVEVATFRNDGNYTDGRHPDAVTFSSPQEDAQRRDFTINGMFYDPLTQKVIDYVDGQRDLQAKTIRAIGNPVERIEEDRLRMLRAVRFAATYSFSIEPNTLSAIQQRYEKINSVSQERITHELQRMLTHPNRSIAVQLLRESRLLANVLPAVAGISEAGESWKRLLLIIEAINPELQNHSVGVAVVLSALLGQEGAALGFKEISANCRELKVSNEVRKSVEWISKNYATLKRASELKFSELQPLLIERDVRAAMSLMKAVAKVDQTTLDHLAHCEEKLALPDEQLNPAPLLRGEDLAACGLEPGPEFAKMLSQARNAQLDGEVSSKDAALKLVGANG